MRPGQCKPRPWLDQGEKEAHARACARALKMLHYYTTHGTGHTAKQAAHAISNTRAPASSALRLPLLAPLALLALLFLPARAARAEAATAADGPAMLYQPGRQAQAEHCCLVTDFDGLTVCAATTSRRLQCRWSLLSSYVVVVECSKLNNAR